MPILIGTNGNDTLRSESLGIYYETIWGLAGNDIITGGDENDRLFGDSDNDRIEGGAGADTLDGGSGTDTLSYLSSIAGVFVNLTTNLATGGHAQGDTILGFENVWGSNFGDTLAGDGGDNELSGFGGIDHLYGGGGKDTLIGGAGPDNLYGGSGIDTASYVTSPGAVTVNLELNIAEGGDAKDDTLIGIENLWGSNFRDTLVGDSGDNELKGFQDTDFLLGQAGNDTLDGGTERDFLYGGVGDDVLIGGAGADVLQGGNFFGGGDPYGVDTASYKTATSGVTVNLLDPSQNIGDAAGDSYDSIEKIEGSNKDDVLIGDENIQAISGLNGDDDLYGSFGRQTLEGGNGNDLLDGGEGADDLYGGAGIDTASYRTAGTGIAISLDGRRLIDSNGRPGDLLISVENVEGSDFDDRIYGGSNNAENHLFGFDGNDFLRGTGGDDELYGGADNDILEGGIGVDLLDGGTGVDTASYEFAASGVTVDLVDNGNNTGEAAGDTLISIENITGSAFDDVLIGDDGPNILSGGDDIDTLYGGGGDDELYGDGGGGYDLLIGGAGADILNFGIASYITAESGVTVNVRDSSLNTGDAAGDMLVDIRGIEGSNFDDVIVADFTVDVLRGLDGNDQLYGGSRGSSIGPAGAGGPDEFYGGLGVDQLYAGNFAEKFWFGYNHSSDYFAGEADTIFDFADNDTIYLQGNYNFAGSGNAPGDGEYSIWFNTAENAWTVTWNSPLDAGWHDIIVHGDDPTGNIQFFSFDIV